jgi:hypothetical protein
MAMPQNAAVALASAGSSADAMWRLAGDTATDYNHYTKRTILAGLSMPPRWRFSPMIASEDSTPTPRLPGPPDRWRDAFREGQGQGSSSPPTSVSAWRAAGPACATLIA